MEVKANSPEPHSPGKEELRITHVELIAPHSASEPKEWQKEEESLERVEKDDCSIDDIIRSGEDSAFSVGVFELPSSMEGLLLARTGKSLETHSLNSGTHPDSEETDVKETHSRQPKAYPGYPMTFENDVCFALTEDARQNSRATDFILRNQHAIHENLGVDSWNADSMLMDNNEVQIEQAGTKCPVEGKLTEIHLSHKVSPGNGMNPVNDLLFTVTNHATQAIRAADFIHGNQYLVHSDVGFDCSNSDSIEKTVKENEFEQGEAKCPIEGKQNKYDLLHNALPRNCMVLVNNICFDMMDSVRKASMAADFIHGNKDPVSDLGVDSSNESFQQDMHNEDSCQLYAETIVELCRDISELDSPTDEDLSKLIKLSEGGINIDSNYLRQSRTCSGESDCQSTTDYMIENHFDHSYAQNEIQVVKQPDQIPEISIGEIRYISVFQQNKHDQKGVVSERTNECAAIDNTDPFFTFKEVGHCQREFHYKKQLCKEEDLHETNKITLCHQDVGSLSVDYCLNMASPWNLVIKSKSISSHESIASISCDQSLTEESLLGNSKQLDNVLGTYTASRVIGDQFGNIGADVRYASRYHEDSYCQGFQDICFENSSEFLPSEPDCLPDIQQTSTEAAISIESNNCEVWNNKIKGNNILAKQDLELAYLSEKNEAETCDGSTESLRVEKHMALSVQEKACSQLSDTLENLETAHFSMNSSSPCGETLPGEDHLVCKQQYHDVLLMSDASECSHAQSDSMEGHNGSMLLDGVIHLSTLTADEISISEVEVILASDNETSIEFDDSNLVKEVALKEIKSHNLNVFHDLHDHPLQEGKYFVSKEQSDDPLFAPDASVDFVSQTDSVEVQWGSISEGRYPSSGHAMVGLPLTYPEDFPSMEGNETRRNHEIIEKVESWNSEKPLIPLKSLLLEANLESKQRVSKAQQNIMIGSQMMKSTSSKYFSGNSDRLTSNKVNQREWNSPARMPFRKEHKKKGKPAWVPSLCCSHDAW